MPMVQEIGLLTKSERTLPFPILFLLYIIHGNCSSAQGPIKGISRGINTTKR